MDPKFSRVYSLRLVEEGNEGKQKQDYVGSLLCHHEDEIEINVHWKVLHTFSNVHLSVHSEDYPSGEAAIKVQEQDQH